MRYILNERFTLCGFKRLPFALRDEDTKRVAFFNKAQFEFLLSCSGKKELHLSECPEGIRNLATELEKKNVIRPCGEGETRNLKYIDYRNIYKSNVQWSITGKCNYHCRHCFQSAPEGALDEPTLEQCMDIIRQLDECGVKQVSLTGGEPLIRRDFFQIVDEILRRDMVITMIYSNGRLITQEFIDNLKERNIHPGFQLSFDGVGYHDWMRGVKGAEKIALDAMRLLHDSGFQASAAMCLCRDNAGSIRDTVNALAEVNCIGLKLQRTVPQGEWENEPEHFLSYDETFRIYMDYLPQYKEDGCPIAIQMEGFFTYDKKSGYGIPCRRGAESIEQLEILPACGAIHTSLYIGPNGAVVPCMTMCGTKIEKLFPNIFETPLQDILTDSSYTELTDKRVDYLQSTKEECLKCEHRLNCCGGCRAYATGTNSDDYFAIDPVTCKIFKEGWDVKLENLADKLFPRADGVSALDDVTNAVGFC